MTNKTIKFYRDPRGNSGKLLRASEIPFMLSMEWDHVCGLRHYEIVDLLMAMLKFILENDSRQAERSTDQLFTRAVGMCFYVLEAHPIDQTPTISDFNEFRSSVKDAELDLIVMIMKAKNIADHDHVRDSESRNNNFYLAIQHFGRTMTYALKKKYGDDWVIIAELYQDIMISKFG